MVSGIFPTIGFHFRFLLRRIWTLELYSFTIYFIKMDYK
jgi:hypothetical protein